MTRSVEDISSDLFNLLRNKAKDRESFCLALDENNNTTYTAQLLIVIQDVREYFEMVEEVTNLKRPHGTTTGEGLF
jgi:hypothetical protein